MDNLNQFIPLAVSIVPVVPIVIAGIIAIKVFVAIAKKFLEKSELDIALHKFVLNIMKAVLWFLLALTVLEKLGYDTKSMVTLLGVCGGAIALSLKDSLSNVAGGIIIIATKPFVNGDFVSIDGSEGSVSHVDIFVTSLMTTDNKTITIPNGTVASSVIINYSKASKRRVDCTFGIGYGDDISHAKEILVKTAESCPYVLKEEEMVVGVADHGESSVNIDLKVWTLTEDYWDTKYFLEEKVKLAFDEAGIDIPYNQLTVHMS